MYELEEEKLHELARLFMGQFNFTQMSLDEYLLTYSEQLTDDERNLGHFILSLFDNLKK